MPVAGVLFDLDGTLIDSAPDIAAAANAALAGAGLGQVSVHQVRGWVGRGASVLFRDALDALGQSADIAALVRAFAAYYARHPATRSRLYPDVVETLEALRPLPMAVVTNKFENIARGVLAGFGLEHRFDVVVGGDTCDRPKPHAAPVLHACRALGIDPGEAVLVGDSVNDVHAARAAGVPVICVTYGYNHGEDIAMAAPDALIDRLAELPARLGAIDSQRASD